MFMQTHVNSTPLNEANKLVFTFNLDILHYKLNILKFNNDDYIIDNYLHTLT